MRRLGKERNNNKLVGVSNKLSLNLNCECFNLLPCLNTLQWRSRRTIVAKTPTSFRGGSGKRRKRKSGDEANGRLDLVVKEENKNDLDSGKT